MTRSPLISAAEDVLRQGLILLENVDQDSYALKKDGLWGASIGAHYRHVLDHFFCFTEALWDGEVNYDRRARNPELETSIETARFATEELIEAVGSVPDDVLRQSCTVTYNVGYGRDDAQTVSSFIARELM